MPSRSFKPNVPEPILEERLARNQRSSLFDPFICYKEKHVTFFLRHFLRQNKLESGIFNLV